jgi:streptogramin lyase
MKKMKPAALQNISLTTLSCFLFALLLSACSYADAPPAVSITLNPAYASPADTIAITANASDDNGIRGIYFYYPNTAVFTFQNCSDALTCTKSVSSQVTDTGDTKFCVRAIDTAGQMSDLVCGVVGVTIDRPPIIKYFQSEQKDKGVPSVHVGGTGKFGIVAEDDNGIETLFIEDVLAGKIEEYACGNLKTCVYEFKRFFVDAGVYTFCAYAVDTAGASSARKCIQVNVVKKYSCEPVTVNDGASDQVVALKITSKRLHLDIDGLLGYSAQCCQEQGFCQDLQIHSATCEKIGGNLPDDGYRKVMWDPNFMSIEDFLRGFKYPQVLCTTVLSGNTYLGVIDNYNYKIVGQTQNLEENLMVYWLMGELKNIPEPTPNPTPAPTPNASKVLIYTAGVSVENGPTEVTQLKTLIENEGYPTDIKQKPEKLTKELLAQYGLVWMMETTPGTHLASDEIDAVIEYNELGGGLVLSGEGDSDPALTNKYIDMVNDVSVKLGVTFASPAIINNNIASCAQFSPVSHPVIEGVSTVSSTGSDAYLTTTASDVKIAAMFEGKAGIMAKDGTGGHGRVVFDSSMIRFGNGWGGPGMVGPNACNNARYIRNIVNWVGVRKTASITLGAFSLQSVLSDGTEVDKYFFAEQLQDEDNETKRSIVVDQVTYSDTINRLLENECMDKQLESVECQFDCLEAECNPTAPCGSNNCIGCPEKKPCECCPQCHKLVNYQECQYKKYLSMYGRPQADNLFCWKVNDIKNTAWCYQKSDQPTSAVNYPWYGLTRQDTGYYRSLDKITEEYLTDQHRWNTNVTIQERAADTGVAKKTWVPEVYCHHEFDDKLLRNIWTKIFTVTPRLNDLRNNLTWTRTGNGALYAGGGFRREPACWWECCRRCAPFCDCACVQGCSGQICCLLARFDPPSVENVIEIRVPYTTVADGGMEITYNDDQTIATADNGAVRIVSTGNMPFELSASFSKDESSGLYTVALTYTPIGGYSGHMSYTANYDQFSVAQDIILNYTLNEDASDFQTGIKESFATTLVDRICRCTCPERDPQTGECICPPGCGATPDCCCCPNETVTVVTEESVEDSNVAKVFMDMRKIDALITAAHAFVDLALARSMQVGLVAFSSPPECWGGICSSTPLTTDASTLHSQIDTYQPLSGTCIACGIAKGVELIRGATGEKHIVVMSDGVPQYCLGGYFCYEDSAKADAKSQASAAKGAGITVHSVALGNTADFPFMKELADAGGGKYYQVTCECPLDCIYKKLANEDTKDNAVLVSDTTGSMEDMINLNCPGEGIPIVHQFGAVNITVNGNIDNYLDSDITTGVKSKGYIYLEAKPDIINQLNLNVADSSLAYYSLVYPVKHMDWRKEYAHGQWVPGYPYAIGEPYYYEPKDATRDYYFGSSFGYETATYSYPKQCENICPADCTCSDYDISDVTCIDASGSTYKRDDCVCLPPRGQTYQTFCSSDRTFHEEEGYFFDFVEMETKEVSGEINVIAGQPGTNPQFTGNLQGRVEHTGSKNSGKTTYIFVSNSNEGTVSKIRTDDCKEVCKYSVGSDPSRTAVDMEGNVWVGNRKSGDVTKMKSDTCDVVDTYKVGSGPRAIAVDGDGNVWVGCSDDNTLWKLDGKTGNCLIGDPAKNPTCPSGSTPLKIPDYPYGAVYDCSGNVWVTSQTSKTLYKVRTSDATIIGRYDIGDDTYGIAIDRNGDIWLGGGGSGNVYKVNGDTGNIICKKKIGGMTRGLAVDKDNNPWVADSDNNQVYKIDGSNCEILGTYAAGSEPLGVGVDFEDNVWVINNMDNSAMKYDLNGTKICTAPTGDGPYTYSDMAGYNLWQICYGKKLEHSYVKESKGGYLIDFQALNFPQPLLKYVNPRWNIAPANVNCNDLCKEKGLFPASECACPQDPARNGCVYANQSGGGYQYCQTDCGEVFGSGYSTQCCCAKPQFKTDEANLTVFIHFRNSVKDQTFALFPKREESKPYAQIHINVTVREPSKITCYLNDSVKSGDIVHIEAMLTDPLTGEGIQDEPITIEIEAYDRKIDLRTDRTGKAKFPNFMAGDQSTRITCVYAGGKKYTESSGSAYMNIYSIDRIWWFLSPEVLLLLIVLVILAFSYKWFKGGGFDLNGMWDEMRGKK